MFSGVEREQRRGERNFVFVLCSYAFQILVMVELMLGTKFPCFKPHTMDNLRARFRAELDVKVFFSFLFLFFL
jgi:hypothetical protein